MNNNSPIILAASAKHTATIIFLHGLGDTGNGWSSAMASIRPAYMKVICPTAPTIPVTLNSGFQMPAWFDIKGLEPSTPEDAVGIKNAANFIHDLIDKEVTDGTPSERIVIGGFSQGGALALYSGLTYSKKIAGIIGLSCWLPLYKELTPGMITVNKDVPILQCHGNCDPIVSYGLGMLTASVLKTISKNSDFKTYSGLMHSSSNEELQDVQNFIREQVPVV